MSEPRHVLRAGAYGAVVSEVGGALHTLRHDGRDLVRATDDEPALPNFRGAVLAPWPNRIRDGRWTVGEQVHQLAVNEVERGCALHGLVARQGWQPVSVTATSVELGCAIWPQPGYPYALALTVTYALDEQDGLHAAVSARNTGVAPAPYGVALHPYLVAGPGPVDNWTLRLPASSVIEVDPARLLPVGSRDVDGTSFDFRQPRQIRGTELDHCYTGVSYDTDGQASAELTVDDGSGVRMAWDRTCAYVQVHTTDSASGPLFRSGLAFEPMTCAPDAFNSGDGLLWLEPGREHQAAWTINAVAG